MTSEPKIKLRLQMWCTQNFHFSVHCVVHSSLSNEDSRLEKMPPADSDSFWFIYWEEVEKEEDAIVI